MPELPEVEWVVRGLHRVLPGAEIRSVTVPFPRLLRPTTPEMLRRALVGARIQSVNRRGKYLVFHLTSTAGKKPFQICAHLGMTGRMDVVPSARALPKHTVVTLDLGSRHFVFEDARKFGRFTLDTEPLSRLGPEPLSDAFSAEVLSTSLAGSRQPIKSFLLDQSRIAGVGNIYASEALFRAGIHPRRLAGRVSTAEAVRLHHAIRAVLQEAIAAAEAGDSGTRFYYGSDGGSVVDAPSRFRVYDRDNDPCPVCAGSIERITQGGRSSFFCPTCQPLRPFGKRR